jgi:serine/threonine protein kinase
MQTETNRCPKCQAPLPVDAPQGLCPKCLLAAAASPTETGQLPRGGSPPPSLEAIAAAFPQLEILELFGQGGMGFIFKARQPKLDRFVALKILPQALAADPTFAGRFNREARVLARLNHPNIVTVHDFGQAGGFFYLLMEFVDGVNLRQAMQAGRFTPAQALAIVPKICEALQFAHNEGILHRDIKPENILLDAKGRVKIADFGIAKLIGDAAPESSSTAQAGSPLPGDDSLTESGKALGTPNYMAPEQRDNPQSVDNRADIYSLGVVFYEMLTGELPTGRFAPPSQKSAADPRVDAVVARALEKEKEKRFASAEEVKTRVETISATPGVPPIIKSGNTKSDAPTPPVVYASKKKKGEFLGVGCAVQAIGLGCLFVPFIGIPLGLVLLIIGGRMALKLICTNCGNYTGKHIKICASCGAHFEKPIPTATRPGNEPAEPPHHPNWPPWTALSSQETQAICSHMTISETLHSIMLGILFSVWVFGAAFGLPLLARTLPSPGNWIVTGVLGMIFVVSLPILYRIQRHFLCSTAWARKRGFTQDWLSLFSFKAANIQTAIIVFAELLLLFYVCDRAVHHRFSTHEAAQQAPKQAISQIVPPRQYVAGFGPVVECVVDMAKPGGYDLDNGRFIEVPLKDYTNGVGWMQSFGKDLIVSYLTGPNAIEHIRLSFVDMKPAEVEECYWSKSPDEILNDTRFTVMRVATAEQASSTKTKLWVWPSRNPRDVSDTPTYLFETREGGMGVLQITGLTENPDGVKIRYKLIRGLNSTAPQAAAAYSPLLRVTLRILDMPTGYDTRKISRPAALFDHGDVRVIAAPYVLVNSGFEGAIHILDSTNLSTASAGPIIITRGMVKTLFVKPTFRIGMGSSFVTYTLSALVSSSGTNSGSVSKQMLRSSSMGLGEFDIMEVNEVGSGRKHLAVLSVELEPTIAEKTLASVDDKPVNRSISAETWSPTLSPGEKPDFEKMRQEANDFANNGRYAEALQRHIWYHNHALEYDQAQSGVRLSFWLADWTELGRRYPRAWQALIEVRDEKTRKLVEGGGYSQLFSDVVSINGYLQDEEASYALFKTIQKRDPSLAQQCYFYVESLLVKKAIQKRDPSLVQQCYFYVESLLVKKGDYKLCMRYMGDPQRRFESNRSAWELEKRMHQRQANLPVPTNMPSGIFRRPDMMREADKRFVRNMNQLIEILVGAGHKAEAEKIRDQALALLDDADLKSSVEDAEKKIRK